MEILHKNIELIPEFLKVPLLVLRFSFYTLKTLVMLSVILLYILTILLSTISVTGHQICANN